MITLPKNAPKPAGARVTIIKGDMAHHYFDGEPEVLQDEAAQQTEQGQHARSLAKSARNQNVAQIKVTTQQGNVFDGSTASQLNMLCAIAALDDGEAIEWVLADNRTALVTKTELSEAQRLAFKAQAALWVIQK